jgi:hypothetical protein
MGGITAANWRWRGGGKAYGGGVEMGDEEGVAVRRRHAFDRNSEQAGGAKYRAGGGSNANRVSETGSGITSAASRRKHDDLKPLKGEDGAAGTIRKTNIIGLAAARRAAQRKMIEMENQNGDENQSRHKGA